MARRDPFEAPAARAKKPVPFAFVLDELESLSPETRPMFGCTAVYAGDKILLILRDKGPGDRDNGVWVAFPPEHADDVRRELPRLTTISVFESNVGGWKKLDASDPDFEDDVGHLCGLLRKRDPRFGKIPGKRKAKAAPTKTATKASPAKRTPTATKAKPAKTTPAKTNPAKTNPAKTNPAKTKPARAKPTKKTKR